MEWITEDTQTNLKNALLKRQDLENYTTWREKECYQLFGARFLTMKENIKAAVAFRLTGSQSNENTTREIGTVRYT